MDAYAQDASKFRRPIAGSPKLFHYGILVLPATIVIGYVMAFGLLNLFFSVVVEAAMAPANQNGRGDGAGSTEAPPVGEEAVATWGINPAERARGHG